MTLSKGRLIGDMLVMHEVVVSRRFGHAITRGSQFFDILATGE